MLKRMVIAAVFVALLLGRPCVSEQQHSSTHAAKHKATETTHQVPPPSAVVNPPSAAPCNQANPCYTKDASAEPSLPRWRRPEWVIVYVTIGYAIIAGLTLWVIKRQADSMVTATEATGKAAKAAESAALTAENDLALSARAWVGARISNFFFEVGNPLEVVVIFENKGKTPAYKVRTCQVARVITRGEETQITYPEHRFSPGFTVVMPDGNTNRMANAVVGDNDPKVTEDGTLTEEIAESIRRNEKTAVTYGQIQYEDIFGVPHWTTFCFNMQVFPPARGFPPTHAWASSDVGNDIDKNQKTKSDQAN